MAHTGPPILASLANQAVSFGCRITYPYTPEFKTFTVSYFYVNRQGQESSKEKTGCQPSAGRENQTHTTECQVTPSLPSASATGTYYCSVQWPSSRVKGPGTFILVRGEASVALAGQRPQRFHAAESGAQGLKRGVFASSFAFG